jgi:hypothetical protein
MQDSDLKLYSGCKPTFRQYSRCKPKLGSIQDARGEGGYTLMQPVISYGVLHAIEKCPFGDLPGNLLEHLCVYPGSNKIAANKLIQASGLSRFSLINLHWHTTAIYMK